MFENLTDRLSRTLRNISGRGRLTEENIKETLREVRMALLEADVALPVVRDFINRVKERAVGHEVNKSLTPGQEFVKIVKNELISAMGEVNNELNLAAQPPAVVLMAGLQGAGKTTSVAKLGKFLKEKQKKKCWSCLLTFIALRRSNSWKPWLRVLALISSRLMHRKNRLIL
ncbi:SRP54-type protein, helical bundle domain protein [Yersinia pestis KIM D27]|nr:SRP54-type protein, helical bundle domain protein [Yersinia pestis KIM D27]